MMFDSHCHPQFPQYDQDREKIIKRAQEAGVKMVAVGTDLEMSKKAVELAEQYENVWASVGLHPNDNLDAVLDLEKYHQLAAHPKVVAIGEVGLDYYRTTGDDLIAKQKDRFIKFLELARETGKPLILHCRDAYTEMREMLGAAETLFSGAAVRGVLHSFTSTWELAKKFLDLGFYLGLNGIITFTDQYNETIKKVPLERLLLETDAPYLAPVPHRGKRNEPAYLQFIVEKIARVRGEEEKKIKQLTAENTQKLFRLSEV